MPHPHLDNLITRLHEQFAAQENSPQQQQLLAELQQHLHNRNEPEPINSGTQNAATLLLESLEADHPQAAAILREIIETLGRLGL